MSRRALGVAVAVLVAAAGCSTAGRAPSIPVTSAPLSTPAPSTPVSAGVLPAELVGAWSSSGENTEFAYRFLADGRYRSIEIVNQPRPRGVYELSRQQDGTARVSGDRLRLHPTTSVSSRRDPGDPAGDYVDRPSAEDERGYTWRTSGRTLVLTDADGVTLRLERQG